jgi:hypothetical protein
VLAIGHRSKKRPLPLQYPSVARFNSGAAPRGRKPKFEAMVMTLSS